MNVKDFYDCLQIHGMNSFYGVPDSLLRYFCEFISNSSEVTCSHIITANEGNAIGLAAGHYLATGKPALVYMQNSGLGNCMNPLASLMHKDVYSIPVLLLVGWRGEPGIKDEPQHLKQGKITLESLALLEIPYRIMDATSNIDSLLDWTFTNLKQTRAPVALVVKKDTFSEYTSIERTLSFNRLKREDALRHILSLVNPHDLIVSTTGKTSREVFELCAERGENTRVFLTVGSMGHTSSIALGVAIEQPQRRVICLDGDGSLLMHMGALAIIGDIKPDNFVHVLLNNSAHESVGGQRTAAGNIDFAAIVKACGYRKYLLAEDEESLKRCWEKIENISGPVFLEVKIKIGSRKNLGRPTTSPLQNKQLFMKHTSG